MYFEAMLKGRKYKVDVTEQRHTWKVSLQPEGKEWIHHEISKQDYKQAEEYISFLFNGQSYLVDVVGRVVREGLSVEGRHVRLGGAPVAG